MPRDSKPKEVKAEKPKKEFKIEIIKLGSLEEHTGFWGAPGNWGKHTHDDDKPPRHSHHTNSYF